MNRKKEYYSLVWILIAFTSIISFLFWAWNGTRTRNLHWESYREFQGIDRVREIFQLYGDDKLNHRMYSIMYSKYLKYIINTELNFKLLEIGVGCVNQYSYGPRSNYTEGRSVEVWKHMLPNAEIYVLDIDPCAKRIASAGLLTNDHIIIGSQVDDTILSEIAKLGPFDMIVDDGSHVPNHQIKTFFELFCESVIEGGIYVIEDLESSLSDTLINKNSTLDMLTEVSVALTSNGNIGQALSRRGLATSYSYPLITKIAPCVESVDWFEDAVVIKRKQ